MIIQEKQQDNWAILNYLKCNPITTVIQSNKEHALLKQEGIFVK